MKKTGFKVDFKNDNYIIFGKNNVSFKIGVTIFSFQEKGELN